MTKEYINIIKLTENVLAERINIITNQSDTAVDSLRIPQSHKKLLYGSYSIKKAIISKKNNCQACLSLLSLNISIFIANIYLLD